MSVLEAAMFAHIKSANPVRGAGAYNKESSLKIREGGIRWKRF